MLGNFSSVLMTSLDRWFIKFLMDSLAFAEYSFAVSLESFLNVAVSPFSITLYNLFCSENEIKYIEKIKRCIIIFACILVSCVYPAKLLIEIALRNYMGSVNVLFILFSAQVVFTVIKCIYVNLYKVNRKQTTYFSKMLVAIIVGIVLNAILFRILRTKEAFAYGTLMSAVVWLILCSRDFRHVKLNIKEVLYLTIEITVLIVTGKQVNAVLGFMLYFLITMILSVGIFKDECKWIFGMIIRKMNGWRKS